VRYLKPEKQYSLDTVKFKSTFAHHVLQNNCHFDPNISHIEVLHRCSNNKTTSQLEALEILLHKKNNPHLLLNEVYDFESETLRRIVSQSDLF